MLKRPRRLAAAFLVLCLSWFLMAPAASVYAVDPPTGTTTTTTQPSQNQNTAPGNTTPTTTQATTVNDGTAANGAPKTEGSCRQGGLLSYMVCPLINAGVETVSKLTGLVVDLLKVQPLVQDDSLYNAWKVFRDFANVSFVLVFFAIIVATGLSLNVNAYSLRTMLPRLVAAVLLVQASFFITAIVVDVGNVLGAGIGGVFNSLGGPENGTAVGITGGRVAAGLSGLVAGLGAIVAGIIVGWPVILLMLATAIISILGVFVTLAARQLIIAVLIIVSPLAFVAMVLPNTDNYFKMWHKNLIRAILLYPLIITILSVAGILSEAARGASGAFGSSDVSNILGSLVPIVAFLSIPATFKMAGNIMGTVSNAIQKRTSGASSRLKSSQLIKDATASYRENGAEAMRDAPTKLGRGRGMLASGNALRFGKAGERAKATSYAKAIGEQMHHSENILDNLNWGNADLMHAVLAGDHITIGEGANARRIRARDSKGRLIVDREGNRLQDKFGNDVALDTNKAMKAAAVKQIAAGGGLLELGQIHDTIFNRHEGAKGAYRQEAHLGESPVEDTEIWFRGIGASGKMGEVIKALPQTNPGKLVSAFDSLTADQTANVHQKAAIAYLERILDARDIAGGAEAQKVRKKNALINLAQVADNQNLRTKIDSKLLMSFKLNAEKFGDQMVTVNGTEIRGDELINKLINEQGRMNALARDLDSMEAIPALDESVLDRELREWREANFNSERLIEEILEEPDHYEP